MFDPYTKRHIFKLSPSETNHDTIFIQDSDEPKLRSMIHLLSYGCFHWLQEFIYDFIYKHVHVSIGGFATAEMRI